MPRPELLAAARRHAEAEGEGDLAGTLETLEREPVYELFPVGRRMKGMDAARRYYEYFFANVAPRIDASRTIVHGEWLGETGATLEYTIVYRFPDGRVRPFRILGILTYGERALSGERVYADEELLRIMFAPLWDEMETIDG